VQSPLWEKVGFAQKVLKGEFPASGQGGVHHQEMGGGAVVQENRSLDQYHPVASRHPSSPRRGIFVSLKTFCAKPRSWYEGPDEQLQGCGEPSPVTAALPP